MLAGAALSSAVVLIATFASRTEAHGYLEQPKPSWKDSPNPGWIALVDNYWDIGSSGDQVGKFKTMAKEKGMSVKDVVLDMVKDQKCGNTLENGDPQPIPSDGKVKWLGNGGGGFTHTGPCEIYLDDKMVLHGDDCENEFKGGDVGSTQTSDVPVDYSACNGKCTLTIYWLAFQNAQWQAYVNCVPLEGNGGGGSTPTTHGSEKEAESSGDSETEKEGKSSGDSETKQEAPSTETEASSTGTQEAPAAQTPVATTQATQAPSTPEIPSTADTKCNAPARRLRKKLTTA
ncbi:hypothetical protein JG687_00004631 [Phytophthora cactorum]|uniref:Uncharacterized protein n=1 Tax=Phytophthora cactorum TaxID=29920 RepID=A0A329SHG0_9STRA|nr:hypothetical protein Pcac1_g7484 [Phytophthora cactorum]KAG2816775.1 hypothetical protein PC111_g12992 [Phytophthora cactorum]KAG2820969.1 hypothetical protein PC112_g11555 [Phytophthora cactorum]KAG2856090.1 hypothetical protein PC113_g11867 [Phytophthora cactorum]KAG2902460.1 hypothetical protein PC114_g12740 [Phytophthora cactorum]